MNLAMIVYSKDRAMQLHATLSSLQKCVKTMPDVFVLYKTEQYQYQYEQVAKDFSYVAFIPETNLVKQTREILSSYDFVLFVVDDTIFYRNFDLFECAVLLRKCTETSVILGFSLRLGQNIIWSHIRNREIKQPKSFIPLGKNCTCFNWHQTP